MATHRLPLTGSYEDLFYKAIVFCKAKDCTTICRRNQNTKTFKAFLDAVNVSGKTLVVTETVDEKVVKSARNIAGVTTTIATILSPYMILNNRKLVVSKAALAKIEEVYA